jgi:preprotein translocase subunit YajC
MTIITIEARVISRGGLTGIVTKFADDACTIRTDAGALIYASAHVHNSTNGFLFSNMF